MRKIIVAVIILIILITLGGFGLYRHNEARKAELATHPTPGLLLDETTEATTEQTATPTKLDLNNNPSSDTENNENTQFPKGIALDENGNLLSDKDIQESKAKEQESIAKEQEETTSETESEKITGTVSQETLSENEIQKADEGLDGKVHQDTIQSMRNSAKVEVKKLQSEKKPGFEGITDEAINNYTEAELDELWVKIYQNLSY